MSFTYRNNGSNPIAVLKDGKKETPIYLSSMGTTQESKTESHSIVDEMMTDDMIGKVSVALKKMSLRELFTTLEDSSSKPLKDTDGALSSIVTTGSEKIMFLPAPFGFTKLIDPKTKKLVAESERVLIGGPSGCGKTYITCQYTRRYKKNFPNNRVFTFIRQEDNSNYGNIDRFEMILDYTIEDQQEDLDRLLSGDLTLDLITNSICIFDDCDNIQDKKLLTAIHKLMADIVTNGRKRGITCVYITHTFKNYSQTRIISNEANKVVFFPQHLEGRAQIEKFLKDPGGLKPKAIAELIDKVKDCRWAMYPRSNYIIGEKGMYFL